MRSSFLSLALLSLLAASDAHACPKIGDLPDFNCDGKVQVVVIGDSLVSGYGDTANNNRGGYVLRTQASLPRASVKNFGVPGLNTVELLLNLSKAFRGTSYLALAEALVGADVVVLDIGRNDRWFFGQPLQTARRIRRAQSLIKTEVSERAGHAPLVITAVLMLPNRGGQAPWIVELNKFIEKSNSAEAPADLRFDTVSKRLLSSDQIHPTPLGYKALAAVFTSYLKKSYPLHARTLRPDEDEDGLYDIYEAAVFGTDPNDPDSDDDGLLDGDDPDSFA